MKSNKRGYYGHINMKSLQRNAAKHFRVAAAKKPTKGEISNPNDAVLLATARVIGTTPQHMHQLHNRVQRGFV